jgi:hypothetical protein
MRPVVGEEGEERAGGGGGMGRVARWVPGAEGSVAFGREAATAWKVGSN